MDDDELTALLKELRAADGATTAVEVKSAAAGLPSSISRTLCALANTPGGGIIILGVDERSGFAPVGLTSAQAQTRRQGLASKARQLYPPAHVSFSNCTTQGRDVVVAEVRECPRSAKPCRLRTGEAMLRGYDGDYEMSDLEVRGFLVQREQPLSDRHAVAGTSLDDLDETIVDDWIATVRARDPIGLGRFSDNGELLRRGEVIHANGELSLAALLSMGRYPQQHFPRLVISAAWIDEADPLALRGQVVIAGPIPAMMEQAMSWARSTFPATVIATSDGVRRDDTLFPLAAFRELVSNALIHRDLEKWSEAIAIDIRVSRRQLRVTNPGCLFGVTVKTLGTTRSTTARNARLLSMCQFLRTPQDGGRVVEALATGIPIVRRALADAGLPEPRFNDDGIRFSAILSADGPITALPRLGHTQMQVLELIREAPRSIADLNPLIPLGEKAVQRAVRELVRKHLVVQDGGRGRPTSYRAAERS